MIASSLLGRFVMGSACPWLLAAVLAGGQTTSGLSAARQQLQDAINIAQSGNEAEALDRVNAVLASHPDFVAALKIQGELLEDMGREQEAAAAYDHALRFAPNDPELLLKVGISRLVSGKYQEAVSLLRRRVSLVPHDRDGLYYLAQAYHFAGDKDLAVKTIAECVRVDPTNASALQKYGELLSSSGDNEDALQWLLKAQKADPTLARLDFDLGVASYYNMDFAGTLKYSREAVRIRPDDLQSLALLADAQARLSQWSDAEETYNRILAIKPDDQASLLGVGHCEVELKQYQPAVESLKAVLQADPTQILAHFYLSRAYAGLGMNVLAQSEADLHSRMLAQLSGGPSDEDKEREKAVWAQARQLLLDHREQEARQVFAKSAAGPSATPGNPYVLVGALYISMGDTAEAARNLKRALSVEPSVHGAHTYLGMLALQQGNLEMAEHEFNAELALHPNDRAAIAHIGALRYKQGKWADAADKLTKSDTSDPALLYMLCDSDFRLGRTHDAEVAAEDLAAFGRSNPAVMDGLVKLLSSYGDAGLAQQLAAEKK